MAVEKIKVINDSKFQKKGSNGAYQKEVVFKLGGLKFKTAIRDESYKLQSHGYLEMWTNEKGWKVIVDINPHEFNGMSISYKSAADTKHFDKLEKRLIEVAREFI